MPDGRPAALRRVLGLVDDRPTGISYARFFQPFAHLADRGFALRTPGRELRLRRTPSGWAPEPDLLDGTAAVMFPQFVAAPRLSDGSRLLLVEPICRMAAERGIPVVYSVDDHLDHVDPLNSAYESVGVAGANRAALLEHAAAFFVTTAPLGASLAPYGRAVHHLPNCVDPSRWSLRPAGSGELRVGWAGSASHLADLLMVLPALEALQPQVDFTFVLMGVTERPFDVELAEIRRNWRALAPSERQRAGAFRELVRRLRRIRHHHVPFTSMERYFQALPALDLDLAICPLEDTPFNRHKSALKFYEYAITGSTTLASRVAPYAEEVSLTVDNDVGLWRDALAELLSDPARRERELGRQRDFVLSERDIAGWRERWAVALDEVCDGRAGVGILAGTTARCRP